MSSSCYPDVVALKGVVQEVEQLLKNASELIEKLDEATEQLAFDLLKSEGVAAAHQTGLAQAVCGKKGDSESSSSRSSKPCLQKKKKGPPDRHRDRGHYWFRRTPVHNYKETRNYVRLSGEKRSAVADQDATMDIFPQVESEADA